MEQLSCHGFLHYNRKVFMNKLFTKRKQNLTIMVQHHLPQPKALHNGQRHITLSNHQNEILNKPQLNRVRFFIRLHISKKICFGCRCGRCLLLAFFSFTTISTLYIRVFVQEIFVQIQVMLICNMFLHGCNAMLKIVSYKSFLRLG
jgi:predicted neutral ceramidase superfamily lipid hydrolase